MPDGGWEQVNELLEPEAYIAVYRFEIFKTLKANHHGLTPCVAVVFTGHPHRSDGSIDGGREVHGHVITRSAVSPAGRGAALCTDTMGVLVRDVIVTADEVTRLTCGCDRITTQRPGPADGSLARRTEDAASFADRLREAVTR